MSEYPFWPQLEAVFQDVFEDPSIRLEPGTTAEDVEDWDSLTNIQLFVAIESEFDVRFNTGEIAGLESVGDLAALIAERVAQK